MFNMFDWFWTWISYVKFIHSPTFRSKLQHTGKIPAVSSRICKTDYHTRPKQFGLNLGRLWSCPLWRSTGKRSHCQEKNRVKVALITFFFISEILFHLIYLFLILTPCSCSMIVLQHVWGSLNPGAPPLHFPQCIHRVNTGTCFSLGLNIRLSTYSWNTNFICI